MLFSSAKKSTILLLLLSLSAFKLFANEEEVAAENTEPAEEVKSISFNPIVLLKDILDDKYPLRIDFGAEPHRHGSLVFGSIWYDWNPMFSASIRGEYDHYMTFLNSGDTVSTNEVHSVSLIPFPMVLFFGNPDIKSKSVFTEIDLGFHIQNSYTTTTDGSYQNYTEKGFQLSETDSKYIMVGPAFNIVIKVPILKYIASTSEFFFVPAYFLSYDSESKIHTSQDSSKASVSGFDLSSPYLKFSLCLDFFRYLRIKSNITYQHINMRQSINGSEMDVHYSSHKLTLRYGGELLNPPKTRKKSSHLWGGLYYEMTWDKIYTDAGSSSDYTGKWVLCFGT